jgi:CRISPR-associated protein Csm3
MSIDYKTLSGILHCETGLHIGGSSETIEIGGMDNPVIRNPLNDQPYIPGSSLKGKMRSLLEWELGKIMGDGNIHKCDEPTCPICRIFGSSDDNIERGPTRVIFRDAFLTEKSLERLEKLRKEKGLLYAENKTENMINRLKGKAEKPRTQERIPPGIEFEFSIGFRVLEETDENLFPYLLHGLWLAEQDALGGSGSRGYGKIKFLNVKDEAGTICEVKDLSSSLFSRKKAVEAV